LLKESIVEEDFSPWLSPAVFVPKKMGDIRICVDYQEKMVKDAYSLPCPDKM